MGVSGRGSEWFPIDKIDWMYPYLKDAEAFANYVESLKRNEDYE